MNLTTILVIILILVLTSAILVYYIRSKKTKRQIQTIGSLSSKANSEYDEIDYCGGKTIDRYESMKSRGNPYELDHHDNNSYDDCSEVQPGGSRIGKEGVEESYVVMKYS